MTVDGGAAVTAATGWSRALLGGHLVDVRWPEGYGHGPVPALATRAAWEELLARHDEWLALLYGAATHVP